MEREIKDLKRKVETLERDVMNLKNANNHNNAVARRLHNHYQKKFEAIMKALPPTNDKIFKDLFKDSFKF